MLLLPVHKPVQGWRHGWRMGVHSLDIKKPWIIKLRQSTFCKHLEGGGGNSGTYQGILNMRLGGGLKSVITKYAIVLSDVILGHCLNREICPIPNSTFQDFIWSTFGRYILFNLSWKEINSSQFLRCLCTRTS